MAGNMKGWVAKGMLLGCAPLPTIPVGSKVFEGEGSQRQRERQDGVWRPQPLSFSVRYWSQALRGQRASRCFLHLLGHPLSPGLHPPAAPGGP